MENNKNKWLAIFIPVVIMIIVTCGGIVYGITARASTDALELQFEKRMMAVELQLIFLSDTVQDIYNLLELRIKTENNQ